MLRARKFWQQLAISRAHIGPAFSVVKRLGARDFARNRRAGKLFAELSAQECHAIGGILGLFAKRKVIHHIEIFRSGGQRRLTCSQRNLFFGLRPQQHQRRFRVRFRVGVESRNGEVWPIQRYCRLRQRTNGGIAQHTVRIALTIALQLLQRGFVIAGGMIRESLPIECIVTQQRIAGGLRQPLASLRIMSAIVIVKAEGQSRAGTERSTLALLCREFGEMLVDGASRFVVQRPRQLFE